MKHYQKVIIQILSFFIIALILSLLQVLGEMGDLRVVNFIVFLIAYKLCRLIYKLLTNHYPLDDAKP
jgi:hypothetical protein